MKYPLDDYQRDKMYPEIVAAVSRVLARKDYISPIDLLQELDLLNDAQVNEWMQGRISYLEKAIKCNLIKASRILQIFRYHVHDLNMISSTTVYTKHGKGPKVTLKFSKTGNPNIEEAYSRHFLKNRRKDETPLGDMKRLRNSLFSLQTNPTKTTQIKKVIHGFQNAAKFGAAIGCKQGAFLARKMKEVFEQHEIQMFVLNEEFFKTSLNVQQILIKLFFPKQEDGEEFSNEGFLEISKDLDAKIEMMRRKA